MKNQIKNILFDFGGVIVDIKKPNAIKRFKEIGCSNIEDFLNEFRQSGIFLEYEEGKLNQEEFYAAFRKLCGNENISGKDIDSAWLAFLGDIQPYKFDVLKELRTKYNVYLLSNTNPSVMGWAMTNDFSPEGMPISAFFDKCFLSYELGHAKPEVETYTKMVEQSGMIPAETLFLDDGPKNIEVAQSLGFHAHLTDENDDWKQIFSEKGLL